MLEVSTQQALLFPLPLRSQLPFSAWHRSYFSPALNDPAWEAEFPANSTFRKFG
jgi:hypothetical protein